jgi:hypothetical protein
MKSPLEAPKNKSLRKPARSPKSGPLRHRHLEDVGERQARSARAGRSSRDPLDERGSFASNLFHRTYDFDRIFPYPAQSAEDRAAGEEFLRELKKLSARHVDADEIDRTGEIPQKNIEDLFAMGAFGDQGPEAIRRARFVAGQLRPRGDVARQLGWKPDRARFRASIDRRPQPLLLFGTEEQKKNICRASRAAKSPRSP